MKHEQIQSPSENIKQTDKTFASKKTSTIEEYVQKNEAVHENEKIVEVTLSKETRQFDDWMRKIAKDLVPDKDFSQHTFLIQDIRDVNAFLHSSGIGKPEIIFSKGLINFVENKDQLAYILGHELTHDILKDELGSGENSRIEEGVSDLKPIELLHNAGYDARQAYEVVKKLVKMEKEEDDNEDEDMLLEEHIVKQAHRILDIHGSPKNRLLAVKDFLAGLDNRAGGLKKKPTELKIKNVVSKIEFEGFFSKELREVNFEKMTTLEKITFLQKNISHLKSGYFRRWSEYQKIISNLPLIQEEALESFSNFAGELIEHYNKIYNKENATKGLYSESHKEKNVRTEIVAQYDRSLAINLNSKEVNVVQLARLLSNIPEWYKEYGTFTPINEFIDKQILENESDLEMFNSIVEKYGQGFHGRFYGALTKKYAQFIEKDILNTKDNDERYEILNKYIQSAPSWLLPEKDAPYLSKIFKLLIGKDSKDNIKYQEFTEKISNLSFRKEANRVFNEVKKQTPGEDVKENKDERKLKPLSEFEKKEQIEKLKLFLESLIREASLESKETDEEKINQKVIKVISDLNKGVTNLFRIAPKEASEYLPDYFKRLGSNISSITKINPGIGGKYGQMIVALPEQVFNTSNKLGALFHARLSESQIDADVSRVFPGASDDFPEHIRELQTTGCNLEGIISKIYPQKIKTVEDVINLHKEIEKENKEFADEFARNQLINVLEKFNPKMNLLELVEFLEKNPTRLHTLLIPADEYVIKLLSYNIGNEHHWPKDETDLAKLYVVLNRNDYFPTGTNARERMGEKIIDYVESSSDDLDKKVEITKSLLIGPRMTDPILRTRLVSVFTSIIKDINGLDDGSQGYREKIETTSEFLKKINIVDRYTLGKMICDAITSQKETSYIFRDAVIGEGISRGTLVKESVEVMKQEFYYKVIENYKNKEKLINFLLESFNPEIAEEIAEEIASEVKNGHGGKIEGLFVGRFGEADKPFVKKKSLEFSEIFHNNFWASSFLLRTALIDKMLHEESKTWGSGTSPWDRGFKLITDKIIPEDHPHKNIMEVFLKSYLDVLPEYQKSLFLAALMTAQQQAQETKKFEAGNTLARILELLGPAEIKAGQVAHSYPDTPPDIANGLGRLKSKADVPTRWDIFEMSDKLVPEEVRNRIARTEGVNAASINITTHVIEKDGSDRILVFERENAKARIDEGFERLSNMAEKIGGKTMETIKDIVLEAKHLTEIEINEESNLEQSKIASENYNGMEVSSGEYSFNIKTPRVFYYGDRYEYMEYMTGEHFNSLPENTTTEKESKRDIAKIYLAIELAMTLSGKQTDRDRHGDNTRIDLQKSQIGLFDFGGLEIDPPTEQQKELLFNIFSSLFTSTSTSFMENVRESIDRKIAEDPSQKSFLRKQEQRFLALGDYLKLLDAEDIQNAFLSAVKISDIDPIFTQKISELFGMSKEDLKSLGGNIQIKNNSKEKQIWNKPTKILVPVEKVKTRVIPKKLI